MTQDSKKKTKKPTQIAVVGMSAGYQTQRTLENSGTISLKGIIQSEKFLVPTGTKKISLIQTCSQRIRHIVT